MVLVLVICPPKLVLVTQLEVSVIFLAYILAYITQL